MVNLLYSQIIYSVISFNIAHLNLCVTIHEGEKHQLFGLVYLSRLLVLSYVNAKPVPTQ